MTHLSKNTTGVNRQSLYLIVFCLSILAVSFLLTVSKDLRTRHQLEVQLAEASQLAARHQSLAPLITELQKNDVAPIPGDKGFPDPLQFKDGSEENYEKIIEQILLQCDLKQAVLTPDIHSILSDSGFILVDLTARGVFSNFRDLILQIGRLPFVSGIEQFRIQRPAEANELEMFLQLRIEVASSIDGKNENQ